MLKIYLAAPFENDAQVSTIEAVENEFDKYGFDYFSPRKSGVVPHLSPEGRTTESKRAANWRLMQSNVIFTIVDLSFSPIEAAFELGYFQALADHFKYKTERQAEDFKRYSVLYSGSGDTMLTEAVDAHLSCESDLIDFCGIVAGNWDAPKGHENDPEWRDNKSRRDRILRQFQSAQGKS